MIPGHDGELYVDEAIRDHAGKGKRELVRRMRYDVLLWLHKRKLVETILFDAGVRLQCDDQLAKTPVMARVGSLGTGRHDFGIPEAKADAEGRVRACETMLGLLWPLVDLIVLKNVALGSAAKHLRVDRGRVIFRLRAGLRIVAGFYDEFG